MAETLKNLLNQQLNSVN